MKRGKLRIGQDNSVMFYCKGCKCWHQLYVGNDKTPRWSFNGDYDKPTFSPSIFLNIPGEICHSFIRDGKIEYLPDCYHELAGKIVDLE